MGSGGEEGGIRIQRVFVFTKDRFYIQTATGGEGVTLIPEDISGTWVWVSHVSQMRQRSKQT